MTQLKLQNIDTAAKLEIAGYEGPFLDSKSLKEIKKVRLLLLAMLSLGFLYW